jgi:hypothetical protein
MPMSRFAREVLARIEHVGVAHQQVELVVRSHGGVPNGGHQRRQRHAGAAGQPLAPCRVICHVSSSVWGRGAFEHGGRRHAMSSYDGSAVQYLLGDTQGNTVTATLRYGLSDASAEPLQAG